MLDNLSEERVNDTLLLDHVGYGVPIMIINSMGIPQ